MPSTRKSWLFAIAACGSCLQLSSCITRVLLDMLIDRLVGTL